MRTADILIICTLIATAVGAFGLWFAGRQLSLAIRAGRGAEIDRAVAKVREEYEARLVDLRDSRNYYRRRCGELEAEIRKRWGERE